MDSITIKTYLLEFIYDLLDDEKFLGIFVPSNTATEDKPKPSSSS